MEGFFLGKHGRDWSHAVGGHWTERPQGSEGSGWSESGMAESPTGREAAGNVQTIIL